MGPGNVREEDIHPDRLQQHMDRMLGEALLLSMQRLWESCKGLLATLSYFAPK